MKTITISITVPDGVDVRVTNGSGAAKSDKPFVERPAPPPPTDPYCPVHGEEWKLIPAGVSKTKRNADGSPKRFNAFWVCPIRGCDEKPSWEPEDEDQDSYPANAPLPF